MMILQTVDFETSKNLKELGFDWNTNFFYDIEGKLKAPQYYDSTPCNTQDEQDWYSTGIFECTAPELSLIVKWFRDIHNVHIQPNHTSFYDGLYVKHIGYRLNIIVGEGEYAAYNLILDDSELNLKYNGGILQGHGIVFKTYEEAELEGIKECIKYLKDETEKT